MAIRKSQKYLFTSLTAMLFSLVLIPSTSFGEDQQAATTPERAWTLQPAVGFYTDYMFRGKNVYEGTSVQPSVSGSYSFGDLGTFGANVWLQLPAESNEPPEKFNELDTTLSYDIDFDAVTLSAGHIFYTFPGGEGRIRDTLEYFLGFSVDTWGNPTFTFFHDYDEAKYQYYTLTFRQSVPLPEVDDKFVVTPYTTFAFSTNGDDSPRLFKRDGLAHVDVGFSIDLQLAKILVSPNFNYTFEVDDFTNNEFWLGVDFSFDA